MYQQLLRLSTSDWDGFHDTLLVAMCTNLIQPTKLIQLLHTETCHWICVVKRDPNDCFIDSGRKPKINDAIQKQIFSLLPFDSNTVIVQIPSVQRQTGGTDYGLFATAVCFDQNPTSLEFKQAEMRKHYKKCIMTGKAEIFPRKATYNANY
jgi:hypothetical protein